MAITILIPDASIFLHAILAISNFAGLKLFLWWNRSRFTLSADGLIGGRIFLVLEGRQIYLSSDDDLFLCEVLATDFLSLFDDIPLNFRSFLAIEIDHDTSLILAPTEVDNCFLTIRVVPQEGVVRRMAIGGRSMIVGPLFEYVLGDNSSFQLPVLEYWRTVYIVRNNIRHVRVILRATEVSFAAESFLSLTTVAYSRFLTRLPSDSVVIPQLQDLA
ncbi:hypothetical protein KY290_002348 [Solanum tuberosum]|uniref:Uncharacterized protein n=1 Tax=Solanum tuberosum TaxID=4113 RepID=A0ABQ7WQA9_SOLTU|nr:hypothetical protein KY289_002510 [Solanum tuberosum]KAH0766372.1 hypothetical protein KY285_002243 [Solanum tuberosum]KAH0782750.1 hypothetical protein KY290_002348 [Solanum tuberosum]